MKQLNFLVAIAICVIAIASLSSCTVTCKCSVCNTTKEVIEISDMYVDYLERELRKAKGAKGDDYILDVVTETDEYQNYYNMISDNYPDLLPSPY